METTTLLSSDDKVEWRKFEKKEFATVNTPMVISNEIMWGLLISAFEGGINYWVAEVQFPNDDDHINFCDKILQATDDTYSCFIKLDEPLSPKEIRSHEKTFELKLKISKDNTAVPVDGKIHKVMLCRSVLLAGLELLAKRRPDRMRNILEEQYDAEDADVFFQYCVFGDTIYG